MPGASWNKEPSSWEDNPADSNQDEAPGAGKGAILTRHVPVDGPTVGQWSERQAFDYETYTGIVRNVEAPRGPMAPTGTWAGSKPIFEWKEDFGDVAPPNEALENVLFGEPIDRVAATGGIQFNKFFSLNVTIECEEQMDPIAAFDEAAIHPVMAENIRMSGYQIPTPIQRYCIPAILRGDDVLSCAQTGSGKTAAFLIPILSMLMGKAKRLCAPRSFTGPVRGYVAEPLVLIVSPTRELSTQIFDECRRFCYRSMLRPCVIYGGADTATQRLILESGCDVLVGTPGRLADFLERGAVSLKRLKFVVIDEADEMLDMGFEPQLRRLLQSTDNNEDDDQQVMMFSATFPKPIRRLARDFLADAFTTIKVGRVGSTNDAITQRVLWVDDDKKKDAIFDLLMSSPPARTLIFVNHKRTADNLDDFLYNSKLPTTSIHGDRSQREREDALVAFRTGKCPIMIATGVAARGLDIKNVMHIINYDLVAQIDEYIHRIGRTARMGNRGLATSFFNDRNADIAQDLVKVMLECNQEIPEFLECYRPEGEITFDEPDSEPEEETAAGVVDDMWGGGIAGTPAIDAWGGETTDATPAIDAWDGEIADTAAHDDAW